MKITFCLPSMMKRACGGFKIVFEYANRLTENGHVVSIVFLTNNHYKKYIKSKWINKRISSFFLNKYPNWFTLDPKIKKIATPYLDSRDFPESDIIFATAVETAEVVSQLPNNKGKKFYLIQGFENWSFSDEHVISTYKLGMKNIVISNWLKDMVLTKSKENAIVLSNPIDTDKFYPKISPEKRDKLELGLLYHTSEHKGVDIAFSALEKVKEKYPNIHLNMFGAFEYPNELPSWITYTKHANSDQLLELYNKCAIFICASRNEGFGLTGAESMACGCALASTDYGGVFEYATHNKNSLLSPVDDSSALANNIIILIENDDLRSQLATQAVVDINNISWKNQVRNLDKILKMEE
ncbi:glycosyl transferase family 1 [Haemophilus paracuniculus]|uniref:Glycosyl transferase family 1 n=1 Tax=Haemophilus paracuniculus TaxID=734 RepID=A0A1T0ATR1_9PAST|nr:glycosyltransferase family 4 protein [Haemophilus paracuniculus]OOR99858.1 glycosyl transferase family 1 [Haemophilus paracuniculus]